MTYEEALDRLDKTFIGDLELKVVLTEALQKRIPRKPQTTIHKYRQENTEELGEYKLTHCPFCFWEDKELGYFDSLVDKGTKFCRRCGQALNWEVDNG